MGMKGAAGQERAAASETTGERVWEEKQRRQQNEQNVTSMQSLMAPD